MHTLDFVVLTRCWRKKKKLCVYKISNSFLHFRSMRDLQLTMNERWGCCTPLQPSSSLLFVLRVQYWRWKITSATMTTVNHIELGHGHRRLYTHTRFRTLSFNEFYLQFAVYKNSTKAIPPSIGIAAINVQIFAFFIRLQHRFELLKKKKKTFGWKMKYIKAKRFANTIFHWMRSHVLIWDGTKCNGMFE